jgi:hypothetical protein
VLLLTPQMGAVKGRRISDGVEIRIGDCCDEINVIMRDRHDMCLCFEEFPTSD